jgi:deazaflavin-dependent oxidoreductase (nitroreductase family)
VEDDLVSWGRVLRIETRGRVTGRTARATLGFVERPDGTLVVAATSPGADWGSNLLADPACRVAIGDKAWAATARPLAGTEHAAAVRDLILRYGTPSEGLGAGPAFELTRAGPAVDRGRAGDAPG